MRFPRSSGILLHVTSLPGSMGVGSFGPEAFRFVDFLASAGQTLWQVLPLSPTGYGNSPYQSLSSFAGNPLFVSLEQLAADGLLPQEVISVAASAGATFAPETADFEGAAALRSAPLAAAAAKFMLRRGDESAEFAAFRTVNQSWLDDYALFRAVKQAHGEQPWTKWDEGIRRREPAAVKSWAERLQAEVRGEMFLQFQFAKQWAALKSYAADRGVRIMGDIPIFTAHDSADVWSNQHLFQLDDSGRPTVVAGVPPDYFTALGQLWGNPLYRWDVLAKSGYAWWIERLRRAFELFDVVRIDHFRGFESYWEVPGDAPDARGGRWVPGPGAALFRAAEPALGALPVVAEDLGVITPPVEALRDELGFPGMRVLQFAFGDDPKAVDYLPHSYLPHSVVYTGTHDNDTTVGWFRSEAGIGTTRTAGQVERERAHVLAYAGGDGREIHWDMIRLAWASVADTAVAPMQDVLGLGTKARMNMPGSATGNWLWRFTSDAYAPQLAERLGELTALYGRTTSNRPWYRRPELDTADAPPRAART